MAVYKLKIAPPNLTSQQYKIPKNSRVFRLESLVHGKVTISHNITMAACGAFSCFLLIFGDNCRQYKRQTKKYPELGKAIKSDRGDRTIGVANGALLLLHRLQPISLLFRGSRLQFTRPEAATVTKPANGNPANEQVCPQSTETCGDELADRVATIIATTALNRKAKTKKK